MAYIIARLVESFLDREDLDELLAAHRANHAAERIARHQENLRRVDREIQEWTARRASEQDQLARQLAFAARLTDPIEEGEPPTWRDYTNAATRDGEMFLISTVGSQRPRWAQLAIFFTGWRWIQTAGFSTPLTHADPAAIPV